MQHHQGASLRDRATRPADQAPAGLGDTASVPCAFTPGPWFTRFTQAKVSVYGPDNRKINGSTYWDSSPYRAIAEANAYLIAAAPDLYVALARIDARLHAGGKIERADNLHCDAIAALTKAGGPSA